MSKRLALLIGSGAYDQPGLRALSTPPRDVSALAALLRDPDLGGFDEVLELVDEPEVRIRRVLSAFFRRGRREDLLLVYFSGHGLRDERGRLYWAARDTDSDDLTATAVPSSLVTELMDASPSRRQVVVLDCCFGGAFVERGKGGTRVLTHATFEGNGYGRVVMTASDSTQFAREGDQTIERAHLSLFTHFLIEGLSSGGAAKPGAGVITLNDWYEYAYERVVAESPSQTPCKWVYNQQGELIIARNPRPTPLPPKEIPAELLESLRDPRTWVRLGAVQEIGDLLRSDTAFADAAARALQPLVEDDSLRVRKAVASALTAGNPASASFPTASAVAPTTQSAPFVESTSGGAQRFAQEPENQIQPASSDSNELDRDHRRRRMRRLLLAASGTMVVLSTLAAIGSWLFLGPGAPRELVLGQRQVGSLTRLDHARSSGARYDVYHFRRTTTGPLTAMVSTPWPRVSIQWGRTINGTWENLTGSESGTQVRASIPADGSDFLLRVQGDKADARGPYSIVVFPGLPAIAAGDTVFGTLGAATPQVDGVHVENWSYRGRPWEQVSATLDSDARDDSLDWGRIVDGEWHLLETSQARLTVTPADTGEYQFRVRSRSGNSHRYSLGLRRGPVELRPTQSLTGTLSTADMQRDSAAYEIWKVRGVSGQPITVTMRFAARHRRSTYLEVGRMVEGRWEAIERSRSDTIAEIMFATDTGEYLVRAGHRRRSSGYGSVTYPTDLYTLTATAEAPPIRRGDRRTSTLSRADRFVNNSFCEIWAYRAAGGSEYVPLRVTSTSGPLYLSWDHFEGARWVELQRFGSTPRPASANGYPANGVEVGLGAQVSDGGRFRIRVCKQGHDSREYELEVGRYF